MILHENRLAADDSHEISCLICFFLLKRQIFFKLLSHSLLQIIGGALRVKNKKKSIETYHVLTLLLLDYFCTLLTF